MICSSPGFQPTGSELDSVWTEGTGSFCVCVSKSYIRAEGGVQHVGLQPFEVDISEDRMLLYFYRAATLTTKTLLRVFGQELMNRGRTKMEEEEEKNKSEI